MTADQFISILAAITLIEMMFTTGLGVRFREVLRVRKNWRPVSRAGVANYIFVPCAAIGLLRLFHVAPMISAGFLIVAVCLGGPYRPPFNFMAKGNVSLAVGLMVIRKRPAERLSLALNLVLLTSILMSQFRFFAQICARGYLGMLLLLIASMAAGGVLSGGGEESLKARVLTTAVLGMSASHWWSRPLAFQEQPLLPQQQRMAYFKQLLWR